MILLRIIISISLIFWVFNGIGWDAFIRTFRDVDYTFIVLAMLVQLVFTALAAFRWSLLNHWINIHLSFSFTQKNFFKGMFFNQVLPGSVSGDAMRIYDLIQNGCSKHHAFYSVLIDRGFGLLGLLLLAFLASFFSVGLFEPWFVSVIYIICLGGFFGYCALIFLHKIDILKQNKIFKHLHKISAILFALTFKKRKIIILLVTSLTIHLGSILCFSLVAQALHLDISFLALSLVVPLVLLITILPISLAGWGVREKSFVSILALANIIDPNIGLLSLIYGVVLMVSSLPGALFFSLEQTQKIKESCES